MKFITPFLILFLLISPLKTFAQTMSNSQFIIKMGNLNSLAGEVSNSSYKLNETLGQNVPGLYSGTNYKVKSGFQYIKSDAAIAFSFSISQNLIDFGVITPTNPVSRTTNLTVSSGSSKGFTVIASENRALTSGTNTIADTTCDDGDCNSSKASIWKSSLSYGFGYRCDDVSGTNCVSGFSDSFYKPFIATPSSQAILTSAIGGNSKSSQITYKVNVSGTQAPGTYTNIVTYIASPGF